MSPRERMADIVTAFTPPLAAITLQDANTVAAILCSVIGAAYVLWKWQREARTKPPAPDA